MCSDSELRSDTMCLLCGDKSLTHLGQFLTSLNCHLLCVKFASGILNRNVPPKDSEIVREVKRSRKLTCVYCRKKGASVGCNIKQCFRTFHLNCGIAKGSLNQHDKFVSYCPQHRPLPLLPPTPRPLCHLCALPVTKDWVQCPSCTVGLHRTCQQDRAGKGQISCPACQEGPSLTEEMNFFGIWFRNLSEERAFVSAAMGIPSATISYLSDELYTELSALVEESNDAKATVAARPQLVKNKFSPINNYLAMQKAPRINSHVSPVSPTKIVKQFSPVKMTQHFSPIKQNSHVSDASPQSSPLKNILEFVPRRSSRSSNSSSCSDVICDGSGSSRDSSPVQIKPFSLPKMAKLTELKSQSPMKSKSPSKPKMGNSPKKIFSSPIKHLSSPSKVKTPTKLLLNSPKKTISLISVAEQANPVTAKPPEIEKTDELVLNKIPTATCDVVKKVPTPKKLVTPKANKSFAIPSSIKPVTPKPSHCRVLAVEYSSDSSEGPLSDIDDILTGNIPDVDKHPMANIIFDSANPYLDQVLERMSAEDDEMSLDENDASAVKTEKKLKKKRKKRNEIKNSPRKSLLLKQTQDKLTTDEAVSPKSKPKKFGVIRQLPLTERQIYHGRNWMPMSKYGDGENESDCDCNWIFHYTKKRLEDITDVNGAEKTLMNMWNVHVAKYQGRGVMHLDKVLKDFLTEHSHTLIECNLYRNFVSHISGMQQASLISMDTLLYCANAMQEVMKVLAETKTVIGQVWKEQRNKQVEKNMEKLEAEKMSRKNTKSVSPSRKSKSSARGRPNSNLPGSSLNNCRSPSRGSPLSPSRPSSISRGRRPANRIVNVQKSLSFDPNNTNELSTQKFNEVTPVKQRPHRSSPRKSTSTPSTSSLDLRLSDSTETGSSDSFHSTKEQELATFLNNFPKADPTVSSTPTDCNPKSSAHLSALFPDLDLDPLQQPSADKPTNTTEILDLSAMIHALTEDPESESEDELYFSPCGSPTHPAEESSDTIVDTIIKESKFMLPPVQVRPPRTEKDYKKLQETEYERVKAVAREKQDSQKVLVLYIDDSMIEKVRSLPTYINYKYNKPAQVMIGPLPLEPKRKRAGSCDQSERSTPDLEVSFPLLNSSPLTSYSSSPNSSNSSIQHCSGGKYGKKRKLRLNGDSVKHTQLVEQLEKSAQLVKEVKSGIMRQTTPTQDLMDI
eukprot:GFUD01024444.1.p1 GENE.GFUD01024444.1~~GFUD01024444.1.p1  ORF type:complete len:1183 (+),score=255.92 GFUD01024444.1:131-3679(+)